MTRTLRVIRSIVFVLFIALPLQLRGDFPQYSGSSPLSFSVPECPWEYQFLTVDIDLDGDMDFVFRTESALYVYYYDQNDGQIKSLWASPILIDSPFGVGEYNRGSKHGAADIDGDGEIEIVALDDDNIVWWFDGKTGTFEDSIHVENYLENDDQKAAHIIIVNLRGEGDRDAIIQTNDLTDANHSDATYYINRSLFAFNLETKALIWRVDQNASYGLPYTSYYEGYWGQAHGAPICADVDGDGLDEVVGGNMIDDDGTEIDEGGDHWWIYENHTHYVDHLDGVIVGDFRRDLPGLEWVVCNEAYVTGLWSTSMLRYVPGHTDVDSVWTWRTTSLSGNYREPQSIAGGNFDTGGGNDYCEVFCRSPDICTTKAIPQQPWVVDYSGNQDYFYSMYDALPEGFNTVSPDSNANGIEIICTIDWEGTDKEYITGKARKASGTHVGIFDAIDGDDVWTTMGYTPTIRAGYFLYVADVTGDYREEIFLYDTTDQKIKIFWNEDPNVNSKPAKWDDPLYRRLKQNWNYYSPGSYTQRTPARLQLKVFLEGPYNTSTDQMNTDLAGYIPTVSPYVEDLRVIDPIPSGVVDWVLIQLRSEADGHAVISRSALLLADGYIAADDGLTKEINLFVETGSYYIVVKHRNHLSIMSKLAQSFAQGSPTPTDYDFAGSEDQYYGSGGAKQLETGVWGMWAGDSNRDDGVYGEDYADYQVSQGNNGYESADFNMDGGVYGEDYTIYQLNQGKGSQVP